MVNVTNTRMPGESAAELSGTYEGNVERYDCSEWLPISISPPEGEDLEICVMDYDEIVVSLVYPCHKIGSDLVDRANHKLIDVEPTHWRKWSARSAKCA
jgi:hypothetical protein